MALSKSYTLQTVESILRILVNEIAPDKVQSLSFRDIINKNTLDLAEMLNGACEADYGSTQVITDAASSTTETIVQSATYDHETRTVTKTAHGLTSADVGKRIVMWVGTTRAASSTIESITDDDNFVTSQSYGADASGTLNYAVLSAHSSANIDLSSYRVDKIIKIKDSLNGLVIAVGDFEFENLANLPQKQKNVFYNFFGETLFLYKGTSVSSYGTLTMHYYRMPTLVVNDGDYIDMKDKYIPLLIDKCKLEIYEILKAMAPKELSTSVESKTAAIRQANESKNASVEAKQKK